jgi:hypothetical protein
METNIYFTSYIAQLLLEWEMFRANVIHKVKSLMFCDIFFSKIVPFVRECGTILQIGAEHKRQYNMPHAHCMLDT